MEVSNFKIPSDIQIARNYTAKADNARSRGIEFGLSFTAYKNLVRAKKCKVSGVLLTTPRPQKELLATDRTIDRIDSRKGYVSGNVMAVCHGVNNFKAFFENSTNQKIVTPKVGIRILRKMLDNEAKSGRVGKVKIERVETPILT